LFCEIFRELVYFVGITKKTEFYNKERNNISFFRIYLTTDIVKYYNYCQTQRNILPMLCISGETGRGTTECFPSPERVPVY